MGNYLLDRFFDCLGTDPLTDGLVTFRNLPKRPFLFRSDARWNSFIIRPDRGHYVEARSTLVEQLSVLTSHHCGIR
jgi:hypothetical protein